LPPTGSLLGAPWVEEEEEDEDEDEGCRRSSGRYSGHTSMFSAGKKYSSTCHTMCSAAITKRDAHPDHGPKLRYLLQQPYHYMCNKDNTIHFKNELLPFQSGREGWDWIL
jgi:hypothetical protein